MDILRAVVPTRKDFLRTLALQDRTLVLVPQFGCHVEGSGSLQIVRKPQ